VGSREEVREQEKRGREILEVGKGGMWQNDSRSKIRNRDEIRENGVDGMDNGASSLYRKDVRVACPTVSSSTVRLL